jgi:hypothetical protein
MRWDEASKQALRELVGVEERAATGSTDATGELIASIEPGAGMKKAPR